MADMSRGNVRVRRVYDAVEPSDGARVLIDRLWPRGLSKADARLTEWCKDVAPSTELRRWYDHREERYEEFATRYRAELAAPQARAALDGLRKLAADGPLTLLTATKETAYSHASVLLDGLSEDS
ncbi:DUF488 domain-containing protein [Streptomyces sp. NPDC048248]|uniref:DUF488 domain-containing protein n=1 Tax=Streptomyces sp. NPDC048248 TaxID=3365523 RepID=UPI003713C9E2